MAIWKIIYDERYNGGERKRLFISAENKETAERIAESHLESLHGKWFSIVRTELSSIGEVLRLNVLNYNA